MKPKTANSATTSQVARKTKEKRKPSERERNNEFNDNKRISTVKPREICGTPAGGDHGLGSGWADDDDKAVIRTVASSGFYPGSRISRRELASMVKDEALKPSFGTQSSSRPLKCLCVHGIGHQEADPDFRPSWTAAISQSIRRIDPARQCSISFFNYDDIVDKAPTTGVQYTEAFFSLLSSFVVNGIGDATRSARGFGDVADLFKRTIVMIAQWVSNDGLRASLRRELAKALDLGDFDVIFSHSLGSLICYDAIAHNKTLLTGKTFVTLGSQVGHPAVRDIFAGRIQMPEVKAWFHLYNPEDHVLTYPIRLIDGRFKQVDEPFDVPNDMLNHDATYYLSHPNTVDVVWRALIGAQSSSSRAFAVSGDFRRKLRRPKRRALLVGINDYPDPANRLEGCVNDVYSMSATLQESTFEPDEIRILLNERATTSAMMDRLHWLLDGVKDGDERFLFYSGHGAQIPGYDARGEPDHIDECLVPFDFDWSPSHSVTDKQFCEIYSQLSYKSSFVAILDCCHSGGMTRAGGPLVRGLSPPDDIRHRGIEWDKRLRMWVPRRLKPINDSLHKSREGTAYIGTNGATRRLGRASMLRTLENKKFDRVKTQLGHEGPFLPILMEACGEQQFSYEYRDGATSYGAYTYCLTRALAESRLRKRNLSFLRLHETAASRLAALGYKQSPQIVGKGELIKSGIPWSR